MGVIQVSSGIRKFLGAGFWFAGRHAVHRVHATASVVVVGVLRACSWTVGCAAQHALRTLVLAAGPFSPSLIHGPGVPHRCEPARFGRLCPRIVLEGSARGGHTSVVFIDIVLAGVSSRGFASAVGVEASCELACEVGLQGVCKRREVCVEGGRMSAPDF